MSNQPTKVPRFADHANAKKIQPASTHQDMGFFPRMRPAAHYLNWLLFTTYSWIKWLKDGVLTRSDTSDNTAIFSSSDRSGRIRSNLDASGILMSSIVRKDINFDTDVNNQGVLDTAVNAKVCYSQALLNASANTKFEGTSQVAGSCCRVGRMLLKTGAAFGARLVISTTEGVEGLIWDLDNTSVVYTTRVQVSEVGSNGCNLFVGLSKSKDLDPRSTSNPHVLIQRVSGDTNWTFRTSDGTAASFSIDSGIPAIVGQWYYVRIELHGKNTPIGQANSDTVARAYIDGVLVGTQIGSAPESSSGTLDAIAMFISEQALTSNNSCHVGPISVAFSQSLNYPALQ